MRIYDLHTQGEKLMFPDKRSRPDDELATAWMTLAPGAVGPEPHIHLKQDEHFRVTSGSLVVIQNGTETVLEEGDEALVTKGTTHTFRNGSAEEQVSVEVTISPPLHAEWMLTEMATSAIRNGGSWKDLPLLEAAHVLHELRDEYQLAAIPSSIQRPLFWLLNKLSGITGARKRIMSRTEFYGTSKEADRVPEHIL